MNGRRTVRERTGVTAEEESFGKRSGHVVLVFTCLFLSTLMLLTPLWAEGETNLGMEDTKPVKNVTETHAGKAKVKAEEAGLKKNEPTGSDVVSRQPRTLKRRYDAIVVKGEQLMSSLGKPASGMRLYAFREGRFLPIPFQVDERDAEGEFVFPSGPQPTEDADKGLFDYNDEVVFLVEDAGDRLPPGTSPLEGMDKWVEVRLSDPLHLSQQAWVYLCNFSQDPPPPADQDYIRYLPETEQIFSDHYGLGYRKGMSLYTDLYYPDGKGGYGADLLDRIKVRIKVKFLFNIIRVNKTENDFRAEVTAWKDGPVRVLRNVQNYVRVLFKLSSASVFSVSEYYPWYMYTPLRITVPFDLKWVFNKFGISDWYWYFYGDLPGLKGGVLYTNRNRQGIPVSTEHDMKWFEERFDTKYLTWGYATKEGAGTWFCNMILPDATYQFIQCYLHIDESSINPPEDVPGEVAGGALMNFKDVDRGLWQFMAPGTYGVGLETFFAPPGLKPEGVPEWRNIREFPVQVDVPRRGPDTCDVDGPDQTDRIDPELCKEGYTVVMTDLAGRERILHNAKLHIGTMRASGWDFIVGQDMKSDTWYRIYFNEMTSIEHRLGPPDPLTGMEHPMVAKVSKKDGKVLDLMACKPCTLSGYRTDGRKEGYVATEVEKIVFLDPEEACSQATSETNEQ